MRACHFERTMNQSPGFSSSVLWNSFEDLYISMSNMHLITVRQKQTTCTNFFYVWKIWAFTQSFHCVLRLRNFCLSTHSLISYDFIALIYCTISYFFTFKLIIWTKYVSVNLFCFLETSSPFINCVNEYTWRNPRLLDSSITEL